MSSVPASPLRLELRALLVLATPLVLTNLGNMALALVDVAVVGRLGETAIASAGLGNAIFFAATLFGLGVLFGLDPLLGQAAESLAGRIAYLELAPLQTLELAAAQQDRLLGQTR